MKLYAIVLAALVLVVALSVESEAADVPPNCPLRGCPKIYRPVCGVHPKTGIENTFSNNCTMSVDGCDHVYVRDGECEDKSG